jgi:hypothetical protein
MDFILETEDGCTKARIPNCADVSVEDVRKMIDVGLGKLGYIFHHKLCLDFPQLKNICEKITELRTYDEFDNYDYGHSFVANNSNVWNGFAAHFNSYLTSKLSFPQHTLSSQQYRWKLLELNNWIDANREFKILLAALIALTSGYPFRCSEILHINHNNTSIAQRNIFWNGNDLILKTLYAKTSNITRQGKPIVRVPAPAVQQMIFLLQVLVLPCEELIFLQKAKLDGKIINASLHSNYIADGLGKQNSIFHLL